MVRLNLSFLAVFLGLAISSSALPTKANVPQPSGSAPANQAASELAYEVLKTATEMMGSAKGTNRDLQDTLPEGSSDKKQSTQSPTQDEEAPAAGSPSSTPSPASGEQKNDSLLGGLPLVGGLLGGGS